jgi:precorrin-6A/cobalt-precorrin-6A reductase
MILILGGTTEGRQLAQLLHAKGHRLLFSTTTPLGNRLVSGSLEKRWGALDEAGLTDLIAGRRISLVVDATHPFATCASRNAMIACGKLGVDYLRLERPSTPLPCSEFLYTADDFNAGAELAFGLGKRVLLTIGSRNLPPFLSAANRYGGEVVVRVLPQAVTHCLALGIPQRHIIAFQGVDSVAQNRAQLRHYGVSVLVCKDSGPEGGTPQKLAAATGLGLPAVVIRRPFINYPRQVGSVEQALEMIERGGLCRLIPE